MEGWERFIIQILESYYLNLSKSFLASSIFLWPMAFGKVVKLYGSCLQNSIWNVKCQDNFIAWTKGFISLALIFMNYFYEARGSIILLEMDGIVSLANLNQVFRMLQCLQTQGQGSHDLWWIPTKVTVLQET